MLTSLTCARCGASFSSTRPTVARTCSNACRVALHRTRRAQRRAEAALDEVTRLLTAHGDLVRTSISSGVEPDRAELDRLAEAMDRESDRAQRLFARS